MSEIIRRLWLFANKSFKMKLIVSLTCIIMLSFSIAGAFVYYSNQKLFQEEMSKQVTITNQEALAKLELKVQELKRIAQTVVFNDEIEQLIKRYNEYVEADDTFQLYLIKQRIDELINQIKSDAPYITSLYLLDLNGDRVYYRYTMPNLDNLQEDTRDMIRGTLNSSDGQLVWNSLSLPSSIEPSGYRDTIVAARWMKNSFLQRYGVLVISIDESFFASSLQELMKDGMGKVYLFNRDNKLLYKNAPVESEIELALYKELGETQIIDNHLFVIGNTGKTISDSFRLVSSVSLEQIQKKNRELSGQIIFGGLLIALVSGFLVVLATGRLLRPLGELMQGLQRVRSGRFDTRIAVRSNDELAYIGDSFNAMTDHVEELINKVYLTQLSEREAELKALQAQLNPHFLHNFFNEIYWKLHSNGERETASLIAAVSRLLHHTLMPVHIQTTVGEEVEQVRNYLKIQAELFESDLELDIQVEPSVQDVKIMRLLLQPLVENVFIHAFRNQLSNKVLRIHAFKEASFLRIDIVDNGCGITPAYVEQLLSGRQTAHQERMAERESLGVRSVVRRIELVHGAPYRLEIDSKLEHGTRMMLFLPTNDGLH